MLYRIGSAGDYSLKIGSNIYRLVDLYSKTLFASKPLNVYSTVAAKKIVTKLNQGDPIGIVRGYYPAGRGAAKKSYLLVGNDSKNIQAIEYAPDNFNEQNLKDQGLITAKEAAEEMKKLQDDANTPWYMKIAKVAIPVAGLGIVGYLVIKSKKDNG